VVRYSSQILRPKLGKNIMINRLRSQGSPGAPNLRLDRFSDWPFHPEYGTYSRSARRRITSIGSHDSEKKPLRLKALFDDGSYRSTVAESEMLRLRKHPTSSVSRVAVSGVVSPISASVSTTANRQPSRVPLRK
jgi:hypothetical protein